MRPLLLMPALSILFFSCAEKKVAVRPEEKIMTEAVYASGTLVPETEYKVMPSVEGYISALSVKEGDTVQSGQVLVQLHNALTSAQQQTASAMVKQTVPVATPDAPLFNELAQRLSVAQSRRYNDSLQFQRYKNLYEQSAVSRAAYEQHALQYTAAQREVAALQEQVAQQRLAANIQVQGAKNSLAVSNAAARILQLKSSSAGVVYEIYRHPGDLVAPGQPVALVGSGRLIAKLLVDEEDLAKVHRGQKAIISIDAFPDKVFRATIERIYPLLNKAEQSFRVDALLNDPLPEAIYGLNVAANIVINEKKKVTVIPVAAVGKGDTVLVKQGSKITRVKIEKGAEDDKWVEVRGGISKHSLLIIPK